MSGSNDALTQFMMLQARNQQRRPSAQARLAEQMMASLNNPAPIYGAGPAIARVGSGVLAGLMSGMAERSDREREEADFRRMQEYQTQREEGANARISGLLSRFGILGGAPAGEVPQQAPQMAPQAPMPMGGAPVPMGDDTGVAASEARYGSMPGRPPVGASFNRPELGPEINPDGTRNLWRDVDRMGPPLAPPNGRINPLPLPGGNAPAQPAPRGQPDYNAAALALALDPAGRNLAPIVQQMAARADRTLPTVEINGPQGPGTYERLPNGQLRFIGGRMPLQEGAETFSGPPQTVMQNGQQVLVQIGNRGTIRPMQGYEPRPPVETAPRSPDRFRQDVQLAEAGRPTTEIRTGQTMGEALGRNTVEQLSTLRERASTGVNTLQAVDRINALLDSGVITGSLAEQRLALQRGLATLGLIDGRRVTNTEQLASDLAGNVLAASQNMTGVLTDRDIAFLREVSGGSISLTPETIRRVAELGGRASQRSISQYNDVVGGLDGIPDLPEVTRRIYRPLEFVPADRTQLQFAPTPPAPPPRQPGLADRPRLRGQQPSQALPPGFEVIQ